MAFRRIRTFLAWFLLMLAFNLLLLNLTGKHVRCPKTVVMFWGYKITPKRGGEEQFQSSWVTQIKVGRYCWWFRNPAFTNWGKGSWSHYLQGFIHVRWLFGISSINNIESNPFSANFCCVQLFCIFSIVSSWLFLLSPHSFAVTKVFVGWIEISWPTVMFVSHSLNRVPEKKSHLLNLRCLMTKDNTTLWWQRLQWLYWLSQFVGSN